MKIIPLAASPGQGVIKITTGLANACTSLVAHGVTATTSCRADRPKGGQAAPLCQLHSKLKDAPRVDRLRLYASFATS